MTSDPLSDTSALSPSHLARLMTLEPRGFAWTPQELASILHHQLQSPFWPDPTAQPPGASIDAGCSFDEMLRSPTPPIEVLRQIRMIGKTAMRNPDAGLPPEIAAVFYYGSILLALRQWGVRISELDDAALGRGVEWVLAQPWLTPALRELFERSCDRTRGCPRQEDRCPPDQPRAG